MSKGSKKKRINGIAGAGTSRFGFYFAMISTILVMPLLYSSQTLDPTLAPRLLFLSVIVLVLLILFSAALRKGAEVKIPGVPFFMAYVFYLLTGLASLFVAVNPSEGLFDLSRTFLLIVLLFLLVQIFIMQARAIPFIVTCVSAGAIIASLLGVSEYIRFVYGKPQAELYDALYNVKGLMGHKNQFAIFLFLTIPFVLFGTLRLRKWLRLLSGTALFMVLLTIFLVQTRSVWIATALFMGLSSVLYFVGIGKIHHKKGSSNSWIAALAGVTLTALAFGVYIHEDQEAAQVLKYKLNSIYNLDAESNRGRIEMGRTTIAMISDKPLLGFGAGNWKINYPPYYARYQGVAYKNWRRPHNDFLWVFSEKGIFGFLAYGSLFFLLLLYSFRIIRSDTMNRDKRLLSVLLFSTIAGYVIISNFSFPLERVGIQVYLCLIMALILSGYFEITGPPKGSLQPKGVKRVVMAVFPVLLFILYYSISLTRSDFYAYQLNKAYARNDHKAAILLASKAYSPLHTMNQLSNPYHFNLGYAFFYEGRTAEVQDEFKRAEAYHPFNYSVLINLAAIEARMKEYDDAVYHYRRAMDLFPLNTSARLDFSRARYRQGDFQGSFKELLKVREQKSDRSFMDLHKALLSQIDGDALSKTAQISDPHE